MHIDQIQLSYLEKRLELELNNHAPLPLNYSRYNRCITDIIGRRSLTLETDAVLGTGVMIAGFHIRGTTPSLMLKLMSVDKT